MTVEARAQRVLYRGNGTAAEFPFDFAVYAADQVRVVTADASGRETERAYGVEFSVRLGGGGVGGYAGGTVLYPLTGPPLAPGEKIAVLSAVPSTQDKSFPNNTPYFQEQIEGGLDKATRLIQQLEADMARSVKVPPTSAESPEAMGEELLGAREDAVAAAESAEAARDKARAEAELAAQEADRAKAEADRAAQTAQLGISAANLDAVWTLPASLAPGDTLELPVVYFPGRNMLHLSCDGVELYPGPQYEEVGTPGEDARSSAVKTRIPLPAGTVMRAWAVASNVARGVEEAERRAGAEADRARAEADRAANAVRDASAQTLERAERQASRSQTEADRAETARTVAQNAAREATEQADRADDAAADAKRCEDGARQYKDDAFEAARCAAAAVRGRSVAAVRGVEIMDAMPSGFMIINPDIALPATVQHPMTPVDGLNDIPHMDGFFLCAPPFDDDCPPGPETPDEPEQPEAGPAWLPCGRRIRF